MCLLDDAGAVLQLLTVDPKKLRGPARLGYIQGQARALYQQGVRFVAQEGFSYNSVSQHFSLGEVGGVLKLLAYELGVPLVVVPPASLKKFATGNSMASKEAMVEAAEAKKVVVADDNQADAFFLAVIARCLGQGVEPNVRAQLEVLHQLQNPAPKHVKRVKRRIKNAI